MIELIFNSTLDESGAPIVCTRDLYPLVDWKLCQHLDENGVVLVGTEVISGMILVGRFGNSKHHRPELEPNEFDHLTKSEEEMKQQFGYLWIDYSFYADHQAIGCVTNTRFEAKQDKTAEIVIQIASGSKN